MHFILSEKGCLCTPVLVATLLLALCLLTVGAQALAGPSDTNEIDPGGAADLSVLADTNVTQGPRRRRPLWSLMRMHTRGRISPPTGRTARRR